MIQPLTFFAHDLKVTWRDGSNRIFLLIPPLFIVALYAAYPPLATRYPEVAEYGFLILAWAAIQGGILFGFVTGFTLLDEKDQGLTSVFQVAPLSFRSFLVYKILTPYAATLLYCVVILHFNPVEAISGILLWETALVFALLTPVMALLVGALGKNKVEGLTYFKMLDLLFLAPLVAFFLAPGWEYCFYIIPSYWSFSALEAISQGADANAQLSLGLALGLQLILILLGMRFFERRLP